MKKLIIFFGILLTSLVGFGQYTEDKLPSGLTTSTTMTAADIQVIQKDGEAYVKGIKAYYAYVYYRKMLDSIVDLNVSDDLNVVDRIDANRIYSNIMQAVTMIAIGNFLCTANSYFTDMVTVQDTLYAYVMKMLPLDTISSNYCLALDPTDSIIKIAPMVSTITELNNVCYVNYNLAVNDTTERVFHSYADAWTFANSSSPDAVDFWTIKLPSGYCNEAITISNNIMIDGTGKTLIRSVKSSATFATFADGNDARIQNCWMDTLYIIAGKTINVKFNVPEVVEELYACANFKAYTFNVGK